MKQLTHTLRHVPRRILQGLIRLYQLVLSPMIGNQCRFHPSCSHYAMEAVGRFGVFKGSWLTCSRLARCHPLHPGGFDPVPAAAASGEVAAHKEN